MNVTVNDVPYTVTRRLVNTSVGSTFRSQSQFVMDGYTMTGYNTKADGTGKSYPYDEITVTEDMKKPTILYAQWKESDPDEETITIDGCPIRQERITVVITGVTPIMPTTDVAIYS